METARAAGADTIYDSRGMAVADFDGDGRLDIAINNNDAPAVFYRNTLESAGNWISFKLTSVNSNRDAVGAEVRIAADGQDLYRWVESGHGFASQASKTVHFGIGDAQQITALEITWPNGETEMLDEAMCAALGVNQSYSVSEGSLSSLRVAGR